MMRIKRGMSLVMMAVMCVVMLAGCSDSETEKKLDGKWRCVEYETEDGMRMKMIEVSEFDFSTHKYENKVSFYLVSPVNQKMFSVTYSGTWSATKSKLMCEIDEKSFDFSFSNLMDASDKNEIREEMMKEMKKGNFIEGGKILKLTPDEFKLQDEEDKTIYEYERLNN